MQCQCVLLFLSPSLWSWRSCDWRQTSSQSKTVRRARADASLAAVDALQAQLAEVKGDISSAKQRIAQSDREIAAAHDQMAATVATAAAEAREEAVIKGIEQTARRIEQSIKAEERKKDCSNSCPAPTAMSASRSRTRRSRRQQQQQQQQPPSAARASSSQRELPAARDERRSRSAPRWRRAPLSPAPRQPSASNRRCTRARRRTIGTTGFSRSRQQLPRAESLLLRLPLVPQPTSRPHPLPLPLHQSAHLACRARRPPSSPRAPLCAKSCSDSGRWRTDQPQQRRAMTMTTVMMAPR